VWYPPEQVQEVMDVFKYYLRLGDMPPVSYFDTASRVWEEILDSKMRAHLEDLVRRFEWMRDLPTVFGKPRPEKGA